MLQEVLVEAFEDDVEIRVSREPGSGEIHFNVASFWPYDEELE